MPATLQCAWKDLQKHTIFSRLGSVVWRSADVQRSKSVGLLYKCGKLGGRACMYQSLTD
jgi:hypothetical protein